VEAELEKIGLVLRSIAGAMPGGAIVVNPPVHPQFAAFHNPVAPISDSICALAAVALCAIAIGLVFSSRHAQRSPTSARRNRLRAVGASRVRRPISLKPRGPHPIVRLAPGRRGKT